MIWFVIWIPRTLNLLLFSLPSADFEFTNVCTNDSVTFLNNSFIDSDLVDPPTQINGYRWYVEDVLQSETSQTLLFLLTTQDFIMYH